MKKIALMAMMLVASSTTFAANSDALKAILKTKTYTEAESLLKSSLSQLANDEEKAKAYNHLVKLSFEAFKHEDDIPQQNQLLGKNDPVDEAVRADAAYKTLYAIIECDKYDQLPDAKGKVKLDFREKNVGFVPFVRTAILQKGQTAFQANDYEPALQYAGFYVTSINEEPLASDEKTDRKSYMGYAAYFAAMSAYNLKRMEEAGKFARVGLAEGDEQIRDVSFRILLESVKKGELTTAADTIHYIGQLKKLLTEFPEKEPIYATITEFYISSQKYDEALQISDERLAAYPDSVLPHAYKGSIYMGQEKFDDAIESFKKIPAGNRNYLLSQFNIGVCYNRKAIQLNEELTDKKTGGLTNANAEKVKAVLREAQGYLEKARELDPDREKVNWAYPLYRIYYSLKNKEKMAEIEAVDPSLKQD